jgi:hypothetical protein
LHVQAALCTNLCYFSSQLSDALLDWLLHWDRLAVHGYLRGAAMVRATGESGVGVQSDSVCFAFGCRFAQEDAPNGRRHFATRYVSEYTFYRSFAVRLLGHEPLPRRATNRTPQGQDARNVTARQFSISRRSFDWRSRGIFAIAPVLSNWTLRLSCASATFFRSERSSEP